MSKRHDSPPPGVQARVRWLTAAAVPAALLVAGAISTSTPVPRGSSDVPHAVAPFVVNLLGFVVLFPLGAGWEREHQRTPGPRRWRRVTRGQIVLALLLAGGLVVCSAYLSRIV